MQSQGGGDPRQTSNATGAAASQLVPRATAVVAELNKSLGLSFEKTARATQRCFGIEVSRAGAWCAVRRLAEKAEPKYASLIEDMRASPVVSPDETGWKVAGHL